MNTLSSTVGEWRGTCSFRLMPTDELAPGPSTATASTEADGWAWRLSYTWTHPEDGPQVGVLLVGTPDEQDAVGAAWVDSWHQKPQLGLLTGTAGDAGVHLAMTYAGDWGWTIDVKPYGDGLRMTMHNVVPEGTEEFEGDYVVMDASWR